MRVFRFVALASVLFTASVEVQAASPHTFPSDHPLGTGVRQPLNWGDFDGDGLPDLYLRAVDAPDRLLRNGGDGRFEDVSATALPTASNQSRIALWRDVDGDKQLDLILVSNAGELRVLHNHGGFFLEGTAVTGIAYETSVVEIRTLDFDADGRLDLELETEAGPSLWHNLGSLAFERVSLDEFDPTTRGSSDSIGGNTDLGTAAAAFGSPAPSSTTAGNANAATDIAPPPDRVPLTPPIANDLRSAAVPGVTKGSSTTSATATFALTTIAGPRPFKLPLGCAESIHDQVTGKCTLVSTTPAMGRIYPLGPEFNINLAGNVGIGTTAPAAKLDVDGTGHFSDTLTLEPAGDEALDVSTGSIYKDGALFIHTKGGSDNTATGTEALAGITTGAYNTANGSRALYSNTSGSWNTAIGNRALLLNTTGYRNTAIGERAMNNNTTGFRNTASGELALYANTSGYRNTAIGSYTLFLNKTGDYNTAIGDHALFRNTAMHNTASGNDALYGNTTGAKNTASGSKALFTNTSGSVNTATGYRALHFNTSGSKNAAHGSGALFSNITGNANSAIGYRAIFSSTTGRNNTASGFQALYSNTTGISNTATGSEALFSSTAANFNTANGYRALFSNTNGHSNTAVGSSALLSNTSGFLNSACGLQSLFTNTTGYRNSAIGVQSLRFNTTGASNAASGFRALSSNTTGNLNTASGANAMYKNTIGAKNTATGAHALFSNDSGDRNVAIGYFAQFYNTTGYANTAIGARALLKNTTGSRNAASGYKALRSNTTGGKNTAFGYRALHGNLTGERNVGLGYRAGHNQTTGTGNIAIGFYGGSSLSTGDDNIAIGHIGVPAETATIRIGSPQTRAFIAGIRGVTTDIADAVTVMIDSAGQLGTVSSSRRFKQDIRDMGRATERLRELRPVVFRYKPEVQAGERPIEYGLIAEEVADIFPELVIYDQDGQPLTVKYHLLSSMLLNELQGFEERLGRNTLEINAQAQELRQLKATLACLGHHSDPDTKLPDAVGIAIPALEATVQQQSLDLRGLGCADSAHRPTVQGSARQGP